MNLVTKETVYCQLTPEELDERLRQTYEQGIQDGINFYRVWKISTARNPTEAVMY